MFSKQPVIIISVLLLVSFAAGRYSVSNPTVKTEVTKNTEEAVKTNKVTHKVTTITKDPSGKDITTITEDTASNTDKVIDSTTTEKQTIVPAKRNSVNVSALASVNFTRSSMPVYGASVSKEIIGPITVGVFGLTDSTIGVSIGLNF